MKKFDREHYVLKEYEEEQYRLDIYDPTSGLETSKYDSEWMRLYEKAKKLSEEGKTCSIWSLKFEFKP